MEILSVSFTVTTTQEVQVGHLGSQVKTPTFTVLKSIFTAYKTPDLVSMDSICLHNKCLLFITNPFAVG